MNNKRVKGWQIVVKMYAEYKHAIQKSRIDLKQTLQSGPGD